MFLLYTSPWRYLSFTSHTHSYSASLLLRKYHYRRYSDIQAYVRVHRCSDVFETHGICIPFARENIQHAFLTDVT